MPRVRGISSRELPSDFESLAQLQPPCAIHDKVAYDNAQEMIDALTAIAKPSKGQLQYLDTLSILFEAYEDQHVAIDPKDVSPLEALKHLMEVREMSVSDLGRLLGERSLGSKILTGSRALSKDHIRKLADHFLVSPALFL